MLHSMLVAATTCSGCNLHSVMTRGLSAAREDVPTLAGCLQGCTTHVASHIYMIGRHWYLNASRSVNSMIAQLTRNRAGQLVGPGERSSRLETIR